MKRHPFHTALAIVTLCVMVLTSTGFTAVVRFCTMAEAASCCCCDETREQAAPSSEGLSLAAPDASCSVQSIAGGRNEIDATVHHASLADMPALDCIPFESDGLRTAVPQGGVMVRTNGDASPPGVDIYIRVNSFLI